MLSTYSVSWLTQSVRKGTFPFIDKTWLNQCAKRFSDYKISIEMNIDKFKLRIKCETLNLSTPLIIQSRTILYYYTSKLLLPSKSSLFAYKLVCIEQPGRPGCNKYRWYFRSKPHHTTSLNTIFLSRSLCRLFWLTINKLYADLFTFIHDEKGRVTLAIATNFDWSLEMFTTRCVRVTVKVGHTHAICYKWKWITKFTCVSLLPN